MKENKTAQVKVRITPREKEAIEKYIAASGISMSDFLRLAIKEVLPKSAVGAQNQ